MPMPLAAVRALTLKRPKKLSRKDPRVIKEMTNEIQKLFQWNCFIDELPNKDDIVLDLIIIPTEVDGRVKVRVGIRGDRDPRKDVDTATELPPTEVWLIGIIKM